MKKYIIFGIILFSFFFIPDLDARINVNYDNVYLRFYGSNGEYLVLANDGLNGTRKYQEIEIPANTRFITTGTFPNSTMWGYNLFDTTWSLTDPTYLVFEFELGTTNGNLLNNSCDAFSFNNSKFLCNKENNIMNVKIIISILSYCEDGYTCNVSVPSYSYNELSISLSQIFDLTTNVTAYMTDTDVYLVNQQEYNSILQEFTDDKIDNSNEEQAKTNDLISSDSEDTESSKCGMICKLKAIWKGIINLPGLIIDGLVGLFIPSDMDFINSFIDSIESKLGFIASIPIQFIEFGLNLLTLNVKEMDSISLPSISIFGFNFWNAQEIDITVAKNIFQPYKIYTDILCVLICVRALFKMYENFTGGGE